MELHHNQFSIITESDLYQRYVYCLNKYFSNIHVLYNPRESDLDQEALANLMKLGYTPGTPDIMILFSNSSYNGLAINILPPDESRDVSQKQIDYAERLKSSGWKIVSSGCYDDLLFDTLQYLKENEKDDPDDLEM